MSERRWIDHSQPQTLQGAVIFSYINAVLAILGGLWLGSPVLIVPFVLLGVAAFGIANERRWGYRAAVVLACFYLVAVLVSLVRGGGVGGVLNLLFAGVLVALLLHRDSRGYQRIFFR